MSKFQIMGDREIKIEHDYSIEQLFKGAPDEATVWIMFDGKMHGVFSPFGAVDREGRHHILLSTSEDHDLVPLHHATVGEIYYSHSISSRHLIGIYAYKGYHFNTIRCKRCISGHAVAERWVLELEHE